MKLVELPEVVHVQPPNIGFKSNDYRVCEREQDIVWIYRIERRLGISWEEVDQAVHKAFNEFMHSCVPS